MSGWAFTVLGVPAPQGSKRGFVNPRTGGVIITEASNKVKPWREAIKSAAKDSGPWPKLDGPIALYCVFTLPRPASARKTERTPFRSPDLDKLLRSTLDGLTQSGLISDDGRIAEIVRCAKVWPGYDRAALHVPGAVLVAVEMGGDWPADLRARRDSLIGSPVHV